MVVLVTCEESQTVCKAFREKGHEAYSNDIIDCSGGHPEWHLKMDCFKAIDIIKPDLMISHPPCTYLSKAGARWLYPKGILNHERYEKGLAAKEFFIKLFNSKIEKIAIENPLPQEVYSMPEFSQIIHPYEHGHEAQKRTCLWLKNLALLTPTKIVGKGEYFIDKVNGWRHTKWFMESNSAQRSKTFPGIAQAMADQWG